MGRFYCPIASIGFFFYVDRLVTNLSHLAVLMDWYIPQLSYLDKIGRELLYQVSI